MRCEILASVMNQTNKDLIVNRLKISKTHKCLIVNQVTKRMDVDKDDNENNHRFLSYKEKGLSRSRNHALENAKGDICVISDDDMEFVQGYQTTIKKAYEKYPDADIIAFDFRFVNPNKPRKLRKEGKVGFLRSMRISSAQISFKRDSIIKSGVRFDERFGTGSSGPQWGEENIFLFDCLRADLNIYYIPVINVKKYDLGTTWDKSSTPKHYEQQGMIYYRMSPKYWRILAVQFVIRHRKNYNKNMSGMAVYKSMVKGVRMFKKELIDA